MEEFYAKIENLKLGIDKRKKKKLLDFLLDGETDEYISNKLGIDIDRFPEISKAYYETVGVEFRKAFEKAKLKLFKFE